MSSKFLNANTDVNLSANSDSQIPSQKAVKTYVDNKTSVLATKEEVTTITNQIGDQVSVIESKIPSEASDTNQLADKQFVQDLTSALNFVTWVDTLPETGESKYIYAVPREETDADGKPIAALYLWDGTRWNGVGAFSLNIDPATLATKTDLTNYLPLTGGTLSGDLKVKGNKVLDTSDKSVANGVASLDANAKVPSAQIPVATASSLGGVKVDGTTITATDDGVISAQGGSGFDFEGTKEEFDAAVAAGTITEDSISLITDDVSGDNVATKAELQAVDSSKADTNLANTTPSQSFKEMSVGWGFPDYSTGVKISGSSYTATYKCWLIGTSFVSTLTPQTLYVNGHIVGHEEGDYIDVQMPIDVGDVVTVSAGNFTNLYVYAIKGAN